MKYTHKDQYGRPARILANDLKDEHGLSTVIAVLLYPGSELVVTASESEVTDTYLSPGSSCGSGLYFTPFDPWEDVAIDTPVWCRDSDSSNWLSRHFAGMLDGRPSVWVNGRTSHSKSSNTADKRHYDTIQLEKPNGN